MKGLGNSVVDIDCNVNIKILDENKRVVRDSSVHNKATVNMVDGILRFMKGDFTRVAYSSSLAPEDGTPYIPSQIRFGRIGVKTRENEFDGKRHFDFIDSSEFVQTVFTTSSLQEPCISKFKETGQGSPIQYSFDKIRQAGFSDANNSECLEFSAYITPGTLVGKTLESQDPNNPERTIKTFKPYHYSYWNPNKNEYEAMITEIALTSDSGVVLARVLFDDKVSKVIIYDEDQNIIGSYPVPDDPDNDFTPIVQTQTSTVVITWRVGIVSVGKNDRVVTQNDLSTKTLSQNLSVSLSENFDITRVNNEGQEESVEYTSLRELVESIVNDTLNGKIFVEIKEG